MLYLFCENYQHPVHGENASYLNCLKQHPSNHIVTGPAQYGLVAKPGKWECLCLW